MQKANSGKTVRWYRTPLDRETLARLNSRSDAKGLAQALGYLLVLVLTAGATILSARRWPWGATLLLLFIHGTVAGFVTNPVHELVHRTVFRSQWLNSLFLRIFAFLGWMNFQHFRASHVRHHQSTLHPPDDLEVVLPIHLTVREFFLTGILHFKGGSDVFKQTTRLAFGRFTMAWDKELFPASEPERRRPVMRWSRTVLAGHLCITAVCLSLGWWLLPLLTSFLPFYGSWLFFLCNNTQHIGLKDNVPDFRLCCRTFTVNPVVRFLYWHMNFHTEHHMYAAVPCYNLGALHRAIAHDLPPCPHGLVSTWKEIGEILRIQETDPLYQYVAPLPASGSAVPG